MLEENNSEYCEPKDNEITALKDEVNSLQQSLFSLQEILEMKEKALANVYKEKEKILADLKRHKRSNLNLRQQLEDEREHHMKEKEHYCREMTESYKYRPKKESGRNDEFAGLVFNDEQKNELVNVKAELAKLKLFLNETLEANYNLSIKFLRMKNTKYSLKARFKKTQAEQSKIIFELNHKLDDAKEELQYIINDKFRSPIPPSNKKYLQIVKNNTQVVHDNLALQVEISKLHNEIERIKAEKIRFETNTRLKYMKKSKHKKEKCDKITQTNIEQNVAKECKSLIFREKEIDLQEKNSEYYTESTFSLNKYERSYEATRAQSAPEIIRDDILKANTISIDTMNQ